LQHIYTHLTAPDDPFNNTQKHTHKHTKHKTDTKIIHTDIASSNFVERERVREQHTKIRDYSLIIADIEAKSGAEKPNYHCHMTHADFSPFFGLEILLLSNTILIGMYHHHQKTLPDFK
jgi:hypothetical protein